MEFNDTVYSVGADEFEDPQPMNVFYCEKITEDQFDDEASCETSKALEALIQYLETEPGTYYRILQKRKQDEMEDSAGFLSLLKLKLMKSIQGQNYASDQLQESECQNKLNDLKDGMIMAHKYAQESKGRRFSKRLAAKRRRMNQPNEDEKENISTPRLSCMSSVMLPSPVAPDVLSKKVPRGPPPLPPCPPPSITPFKPRNITSTPYQIARRPGLRHRTESCTSMDSIHQELLACDQFKRLKAVHSSKSPGGTPSTPRARALARGKGSLNLDSSYTNPLDSSEPLSKAFIRILEHKFRNIRSPSPAVSSREQSFNTSGFTP